MLIVFLFLGVEIETYRKMIYSVETHIGLAHLTL